MSLPVTTPRRFVQRHGRRWKMRIRTGHHPTAKDQWTARVCDRIREIFETDCDVYFVFNGTAANALALAQLCHSFESVICHEHSHIHTDECGAPEFFTKGSKLLLIDGANGKIDINQAAVMIARQNKLHSHRPRAISITQSTELGASLHTRGDRGDQLDLRLLAKCCCTWTARVLPTRSRRSIARRKRLPGKLALMFLCFGGTKNGVAAGELVIFSKRAFARIRLSAQASEASSVRKCASSPRHGSDF